MRAKFTALSQGIYCIDALYVKADVASIYLLQQADEVAIIETGTYHSMENVLATLEALGIADSQVRYVIPTHVHLDHAGGAGAMMQRFEQASLIIHPRGARHMIDPEKLIAGTVAVYGQDLFDRLYGRIEPIAEDRVIVGQDLDRYHLGTRELVFIDTPGHARHHFCIYDETSSGVFTGDTFGICYDPMKHLSGGLLPSCPPTQFDPTALRESVNRIMNFAPERLFLTHYGELANPAAQLTSFNRWIDEYVDLCSRMSPADQKAEQTLENALMQTVLDRLLPAGNGRREIAKILQNDIKLNAQGLAHWWRQGSHV
ncbi:MAG: MBL fold metallo-hydrolase [Gammaproteobacteria bacterium]|nr:MBL fold metallo-hydrolase [Gammaproteobacteria bacterium]